ncbi:hypothetical protein P43SY_010349 [Pythium insidiosum]|uniref:Uncharacterized protein n=1 Tax=Pythium insidiosum TaxID=114742 RepID=A0AAD5LQE5_PYTIN|nr:hypothetical protein P43SY_010349 [Pythium insidiosum]
MQQHERQRRRRRIARDLDDVARLEAASATRGGVKAAQSFLGARGQSKMEIALEHVAVGCNAISSALSCNRALPASPLPYSGDRDVYCAAFAAKNAVALVTRTPRQQLHAKELLLHRRAVGDATRITSVWLHAPSSGSARVLAGDSEGNVWLWIRPDSTATWELTELSTLLVASSDTTAATAGVSAVSAVETHRRWLYVAAFSDGRMVVMEQERQLPVALRCVVSLGVKHIMEDLACVALRNQESEGKEEEEENVLVASGGVDCKVHLFEIAAGSREMRSLLALEGHRGWIRAVDFQRRASGDDGNEILLASASQDQRTLLLDFF